MFKPLTDEEKADVLARLSTLEGYINAYKHLQRQLASPPPGWFAYGTHQYQEATAIAVWGEGVDGLPIWERPM